MNTLSVKKTDRGIATILLISMLTQFVGIEGVGVSPIKVVIMGISALLFIFKYNYRTNAVTFGLLFLVSILFCSLYAEEIRYSTVIYFAMYVFMYMCFYNLIFIKHAISTDYFVFFCKNMIYAFVIVLIIQQFLFFVGIRNFPIFNLTGQEYLLINKLPSLCIEPSHSARVLGCLFIGYLYGLEFQNRANLSYKLLFEKQHRLVVLAFLYAIFSMGSSTGFIMIALALMKFTSGITVIVTAILIVLGVIISPLVDIPELNRLVAVINASMTGDVQTIYETDSSASSRISPLLNTFLDTDLTQSTSWFGNGTIMEKFDVANYYDVVMTNKLSIVDQYGLIGLIASLVFIYKCCISRFLSVETLVFAFVLGMSVGNIYYTWGCLMLFTCITYLKIKEYGR